MDLDFRATPDGLDRVRHYQFVENRTFFKSVTARPDKHARA